MLYDINVMKRKVKVKQSMNKIINNSLKIKEDSKIHKRQTKDK